MTNNIYCTYLTIYSGNKLPRFYIGSTSIDKIDRGYHGSVSSKKYKKIWNSELKEHPELFKTQILTTHETREEAFNEEVRYQKEHDVVNSNLYINMAIANKKLMCTDYNDIERNKKISNSWTEERRIKHSETMKKIWESEEYRKKQLWTEERRIKNSELAKKQWESEEARNIRSEISKKQFQTEDQKQNHVDAMKKLWESEEYRKKHSEAQKKRFDSEEERKKYSEASKKLWESEEYRKKQSESRKGK